MRNRVFLCGDELLKSHDHPEHRHNRENEQHGHARQQHRMIGHFVKGFALFPPVSYFQLLIDGCFHLRHRPLHLHHVPVRTSLIE